MSPPSAHMCPQVYAVPADGQRLLLELNLPEAMVPAFWGPRARLPFSASVTALVGGRARGLPIAATVHRPTAEVQLSLSSALPLAPGSTIIGFRLSGRYALEVHATEPPPAAPSGLPSGRETARAQQGLAMATPQALAQQALPAAQPPPLLPPASLL